MQTAQLTEAFEMFCPGMPSAAAMAVATADSILSYAQPYVAELPAAVLAVVRTEPSGAVGLSYRLAYRAVGLSYRLSYRLSYSRRYVRTVLAPGVRRVAATLKAHGATIEVSAALIPRPANSSAPC